MCVCVFVCARACVCVKVTLKNILSHRCVFNGFRTTLELCGTKEDIIRL